MSQSIDPRQTKPTDLPGATSRWFQVMLRGHPKSPDKPARTRLTSFIPRSDYEAMLKLARKHGTSLTVLTRAVVACYMENPNPVFIRDFVAHCEGQSTHDDPVRAWLEREGMRMTDPSGKRKNMVVRRHRDGYTMLDVHTADARVDMFPVATYLRLPLLQELTARALMSKLSLDELFRYAVVSFKTETAQLPGFALTNGAVAGSSERVEVYLFADELLHLTELVRSVPFASPAAALHDVLQDFAGRESA